MKYPILTIPLVGLALATLPLQSTAADTAENLFRDYCAGCHGGKPPHAPAERAAQTIRNGLPGKGMPAFGTQLSGGDIRALAELLDARSRTQSLDTAASTASTAIATGASLPAGAGGQRDG